MISVEQTQTIHLGRTGEQDVTEIVFDIAPWLAQFGQGNVLLNVKRACDTIPYPANIVVVGNTAVWTVSKKDVESYGTGKAELTYLVDGQIKKSVIYKTYTEKSLADITPTPENGDTWLDAMTKQVLKAEGQAVQSESYAHGGTGARADEETDNAKYYSEQANLDAQTTDADRQVVEQAKTEVLESAKEVGLNKQAVENVAKNVTDVEVRISNVEDDIKLMQTDVKSNKDAVDTAKTEITGIQTDVTAKAKQVATDKDTVVKAVNGFDQKVTDATGTINTAKTKAITDIDTAKTGAVGSVTAEGTTQVDAVKQEGATQKKAIDDAVNGIVADRAQIEQNKSDILSISKMFPEKIETFNQDYSEFTLFPNKQINQNGINLSESKSFSVWQLKAKSTFVIYFKSNNYTPPGGYISIGSNEGRKTNQQKNLPTAETPLYIKKGEILNISVYTNFGNFVFYSNINHLKEMSKTVDITKNVLPIVDKSKSIKAIYNPKDLEKECAEGYTLYRKTMNSDKMVSLRLVHSLSVEKNSDVWRLDAVYGGRFENEAFVTEANLVGGGEWAMALKVKGASDFIGGSYHGDETITSCYLFIDNKRTEIIKNDFEFNELKIIENTNLFHPDTKVQVATCSRVITINYNDIVIENNIKWMGDYLMDWSYISMLCTMRTYQDKQVTSKGLANNDYIEYDISKDNFDNSLAPIHAKEEGNTNRKFIAVYGNNFYSSTECLKVEPELKDRATYVFNKAPYNKIYNSFCSDNYQVHTGDVWKSKYRYILEYR